MEIFQAFLRLSTTDCGFAAAQCGKGSALPLGYLELIAGYASNLRRSLIRKIGKVPERHSLSALCCGRAAGAFRIPATSGL